MRCFCINGLQAKIFIDELEEVARYQFVAMSYFRGNILTVWMKSIAKSFNCATLHLFF